MKQKVFVLIALVAWSCKAERNAEMPSAPPAPPSAQSAASGTALRVGGGAPAPLPAAAPALPHMIIRTADVNLVVADAASSVEMLSRLAAENGGYVTDSRVWRDGRTVRATLTLRVPAPRLDAALAALRKSATRVESESVSGDDVTQEYVDLESQVRNLEAAETEMRALMTDIRQRTKKADDILEIYQQLTQLRGQIETAKGRMRYLAQLNAMSTIKVTLTPDAATKPLADRAWEPAGVLKDAGRALVTTAEVLADVAIWIVVYFGPLLLILGGMLFVVWRVVRRRRDVVASHP